MVDNHSLIPSLPYHCDRLTLVLDQKRSSYRLLRVRRHLALVGDDSLTIDLRVVGSR